jgi:hypothetical protein
VIDIPRSPTVLGVLFFVSGSLGAQAAPHGRAGLTAEHLTRSRWLHGRQQSRFTAFRGVHQWLHIDSIVPERRQRGRTLQLRLDDGTNFDATATLHVDATGAWRGATAAFTKPLEPDSFRFSATRSARWRLLDQAGEASLLEARLWGLVPGVRQTRLQHGARWTDTLDFVAEQDGFRQALRGVRVSVVLGDTVIGGHRLWVIGDSAQVHYEERVLDEERTLDTVVAVDRTAEGTVRGRHVYDSALGLFVVRHDTTALTGEAVLRYPDGRSFRTPARYEAFGSWTMRDSVSQRRRADEIRLAEESGRTGMLVLPVNDLQRALDRGDPGVRDSLIDAWERTSDPDDFDHLYALLASWGGADLERRVTDRRIAMGDTALVLAILEEEGKGYGRQLDTEETRVLLSFLEDPGLLLAFGVDRDPLYESIVYGVTYHPPAGTRDTLEWPCTPDACRMLGEQWHRATEPRLRSVGLAVLAATDPSRWIDTLLAHAKPVSQLRSIRQIAALTWPDVGADWHEWRRHALDDSCLRPPNCRARVSISSEGQAFLRLHQARGTRDFASEIATRFRVEPSDSARLVFGIVRLAFEQELNPDSVAVRLRSPSPPLRALARGELEHLFKQRLLAADSTTVTEILDQYLAATYTASPRWQSLDDLTSGRAPEMGPDPQETEPGAYFSADDLPPVLRRKWAGRAPLISGTEWQAGPDREQRSINHVTVDGRVGPFVRVSVVTSARLARRADESPHGYASGSSFILLKLGGAWVVVASLTSWIS